MSAVRANVSATWPYSSNHFRSADVPPSSRHSASAPRADVPILWWYAMNPAGLPGASAPPSSSRNVTVGLAVPETARVQHRADVLVGRQCRPQRSVDQHVLTMFGGGGRHRGLVHARSRFPAR